MLITRCSEVLNEKVSKRSIQSDIQFLRGNGAPIVVNDKKYYSYENNAYSILQSEIPAKLEQQFKECLDFAKAMSIFPKYKEYKNLSTFISRKNNENNYVKFDRQLQKDGYFLSQTFYTNLELRRLTSLIRSENITHSQSIIGNEKVLKILLNTKLRKLINKIDSRIFLVDALFSEKQNNSDFQQFLELPMQHRKIPQNLTLWGYPSAEKHEEPDKKILYQKTFAVQIFLKDVQQNTGALQVLPGSHQRELSPLEVRLIVNNTSPIVCEVNKGGIICYNPVIIRGISRSGSPKEKQSITLWFSSYQLPVHYVWNNEIKL